MAKDNCLEKMAKSSVASKRLLPWVADTLYVQLSSVDDKKFLSTVDSKHPLSSVDGKRLLSSVDRTSPLCSVDSKVIIFSW